MILHLRDEDLKELVFDEEQKEIITFWWFMMGKLFEHEVYHRGELSVYLKRRISK